MTPRLAVVITASRLGMSCPWSWLFLCFESTSVQEILANHVFLLPPPRTPLHSPSLSHYFPAIGRAGIYKPSGFISGTGVGVEAEARDSQMAVWEKLEGVKALGLYRKLPPDITVLAGSACCSGCCHPCSLGSSDERRQ